MRRQEHYFNLAPTTRPIGKHARKTFTHNTATTDFLLHFSTLPFLFKTITNRISFFLTKPSSRNFHQPPTTSSSLPICFTNFSSWFSSSFSIQLLHKNCNNRIPIINNCRPLHFLQEGKICNQEIHAVFLLWAAEIFSHYLYLKQPTKHFFSSLNLQILNVWVCGEEKASNWIACARTWIRLSLVEVNWNVGWLIALPEPNRFCNLLVEIL